MSSVKTAISLNETLFEQVEALARDLGVSRSRVVALALEAFVRRHENRRLFDRINAAYEDGPDPSEQELLRAMRESFRKVVEGEWS